MDDGKYYLPVGGVRVKHKAVVSFSDQIDQDAIYSKSAAMASAMGERAPKLKGPYINLVQSFRYYPFDKVRSFIYPP
jgi:hypothetical protein